MAMMPSDLAGQDRQRKLTMSDISHVEPINRQAYLTVILFHKTTASEISKEFIKFITLKKQL